MNWEAVGSAHVDFNSVRDDGTLRVLRRRLLGLVPGEGDPILLVDGEGHSCQGQVLQVADGWVSVAPAWSSWNEPAEETFLVLGFRSSSDTSTVARPTPKYTITQGSGLLVA
jgi:hypothetical protein